MRVYSVEVVYVIIYIMSKRSVNITMDARFHGHDRQDGSPIKALGDDRLKTYDRKNY